MGQPFKKRLEEANMGPFVPGVKYTGGFTRDRYFTMKNRGLKAPDVHWDYSEEEYEELVRCSRDINYFTKYVKILNLDRGEVYFDPRWYQEELYNLIIDERFVVVLAPRQSGKTTSAVVAILYLLMFNDKYKISIQANKGSVAKDILKKVKEAYEHLPYWLKAGVVTWAKESIEFDNGSIMTSGTTTEDAGRSGANNLLVLEEFAFVDSHIAKEFYTAVYPTITSGKTSKILMISTANGVGNVYHETYTKATQGLNNYKPYRIHVEDIPVYSEEFKQETISAMGELGWNQEFACRFIGSSRTLIKGDCIENFVAEDPLERIEIYDGVLNVYSEPISGHIYAAGGDCADGVGQDNSVCYVLDITNPNNIKEACAWHSNTVGTDGLAGVIDAIGRHYNNANVLVENNNMGIDCISRLVEDYEYENLMMYDGSDTPNKYGIRTNKATKHRMCTNAKKIIEDGRFVPKDRLLIEEMACFVRNPVGGFSGKGAKDDHMMALLFALFSVSRELADMLDFDEGSEVSKELPKYIESISPFDEDDISTDDNDEESSEHDMPDINFSNSMW